MIPEGNPTAHLFWLRTRLPRGVLELGGTDGTGSASDGRGSGDLQAQLLGLLELDGLYVYV